MQAKVIGSYVAALVPRVVVCLLLLFSLFKSMAWGLPKLARRDTRGREENATCDSLFR